MKQHIIQWTAPSPLWTELITNGATHPVGFGVPSILRFATDDFMQVYMDTLATDPRKLGEFRAVPETWRGMLGQPLVPAAAPGFALPFQRRGSRFRRILSTGAKATSSSDAAALPRLKLYQAAHQRHYLLSACLVCESPGLPDRKVDAGHQEAIGFVMRRLFQPTGGSQNAADWDEYAWVNSPTGYVWQKVRAGTADSDAIVVPGEERLPLFSTTFQEDDLRPRRLVSGIIPVAKREAYLGAQRQTTAGVTAPNAITKKTARKILLRKQVIEPWKAIVAQAHAIEESIKGTDVNGNPMPEIPEKRKARQTGREQAQVLSWLVLLDLAEYLQSQIPELWRAILSGQRPLDVALRTAYDILEGATLSTGLRDAIQHDPSDDLTSAKIYGDSSVPHSLREALALFGQPPDGINATLKQQLEAIVQPYDRSQADKRDLWPTFVFPLADPEFPNQPLAADLGISLDAEEIADLSEPPAQNLDQLTVALVRALPDQATGPEPEIPTAAKQPADLLDGVFRIRCVYERPACGPLHEDVVSEPTEPFDLAGFFDPDAPARPIRIGLPLDTSPAGLRKFDKNTAFIMSDILCGQVKRMKGLTFGDLVLSVLPWPFHKDISVPDGGPCKAGDGSSIGTICSLSIPIITLCALILLMIIVTLLDFIFRWLPFFIICFPIPGLKGKKP